MPVKHTAYRPIRSPSNQEIKPESKLEREREREKERERECMCVCVALVLGWKPEGREVSPQLCSLLPFLLSYKETDKLSSVAGGYGKRTFWNSIGLKDGDKKAQITGMILS